MWIKKNDGRNWISLGEKEYHLIRQKKRGEGDGGGSLCWSEIHVSKNKREKTWTSHYFKERNSPFWVLLCGLIDSKNWKSRHLGSVPVILLKDIFTGYGISWFLVSLFFFFFLREVSIFFWLALFLISWLLLSTV